MARWVYAEGERESEKERKIASDGARGRTKLVNMHGPNGTGRGRDKGRLIFPAFHFVPSLFYFGANCYRYPLRHRRWPSWFLLLPRTRAKPSCNLKFSHSYLISRTILSKGRKRRPPRNSVLHSFDTWSFVALINEGKICVGRRS